MQVNTNKCLGEKCHQVCKMACPERAIRRNEQGHFQIDWEKCNNCKTCKVVCTYRAIED